MAQKRICMVAHRETWVHNHCDESLSPFNRISRRHRFHEFPCFCVISASQRATLQHYRSRGGHLPVAPDNRRARRGMRPRTLTRVDSGNKERRVRDTRCAYRVGGDGEKCAALKKKKKRDIIKGAHSSLVFFMWWRGEISKHSHRHKYITRMLFWQTNSRSSNISFLKFFSFSFFFFGVRVCYYLWYLLEYDCQSQILKYAQSISNILALFVYLWGGFLFVFLTWMIYLVSWHFFSFSIYFYFLYFYL